MLPNQPLQADTRAGFINENLQVEIERIGTDIRVRASLEIQHVGVSLGVRPTDDLSDVDVFQPNDAVRVRFSRDRDASYAFNARIVDVDGSAGLLWLTSPINIERIQARRHVRVSLRLGGSVAPAGPRRIGADASGYSAVSIVDFSAGGIAIRTSAVLEVDDIVLVEARVPDRRGEVTLDARARVVRSVIDSSPTEETCYRYGLEYTDLGSKQEAQLVASVFFLLGQQRDQ